MTIINKQKMARRETSSEPSYLSLRIESTCPEYAMSCLRGKSIWKWNRGINRLVPHVKCPKEGFCIGGMSFFEDWSQASKSITSEGIEQIIVSNGLFDIILRSVLSSSFRCLFLTMTIFPYKMAKVFCHDEEISVPEWASCQEKDLSFSLCAKIWNVCGEFSELISH